MTEILKNIALAAGVFYLGYRIYSTYIRPIWNLRGGRDGFTAANEKKTELPVAPQHVFQDVA